MCNACDGQLMNLFSLVNTFYWLLEIVRRSELPLLSALLYFLKLYSIVVSIIHFSFV